MELYADDKNDVSIANIRGRSLSISGAVRGDNFFFFNLNRMVIFSLHKTKIPNSILAERNIVDLLFNRHLNIDLKDNQGITAAMIAAKNGILQCKMNPQKNDLFNSSQINYRKTAHS